MHLIKMLRFIILRGAVSLFCLLIACGDDQINVPDVPLEGKVAGVDWKYKFGGASLFSSDFKYKFLLLSTIEFGDDPCPIISSSKPHLQIVLPLNTGSYSLPLPIFSENLKFVMGDGQIRSATAGFIEIVAIDNGQLISYLKADFDEDNQVLGTFVVELC